MTFNLYTFLTAVVASLTLITITIILAKNKALPKKIKIGNTEIDGNSSESKQINSTVLSRQEVTGIDYKLAYFIVQRDSYYRKKLESIFNIERKQKKTIRDAARCITKILTDHFEELLKKANYQEITTTTDDYRIYAMATQNNVLSTKNSLEQLCEEYVLRDISTEIINGTSQWENFVEENAMLLLSENEKKMDIFHIRDGAIKKEDLKKAVREDIGKILFNELASTISKLRDIEIDGYSESKYYETKIKELHTKNHIEYIPEDII